MSHDQNCHHHHGHGNNNRKVLFFAFALTALFAGLEITYGVISGSLALMSEGIHMGSDGISLFIAALAVWLATKPGKYPLAEPIAAFINGVGLLLIPIIVMVEGIKRLINGSQDILSKEMFVVATIGLVVNIIVAYILSRGGKDNINVRAAMLHILADLLSSASTIAVSLLIMYFDLKIIDPIASIIISIVIFAGGWKITKESLSLIKQHTLNKN
ncbi:cation diffusion facilitator family transporter [[Brevibacterium] frigoritolerans]|nr:cation diffusion facilitator family transporter [Peribacillus frigoritolerans]